MTKVPIVVSKRTRVGCAAAGGGAGAGAGAGGSSAIAAVETSRTRSAAKYFMSESGPMRAPSVTDSLTIPGHDTVRRHTFCAKPYGLAAPRQCARGAL